MGLIADADLLSQHLRTPGANVQVFFFAGQFIEINVGPALPGLILSGSVA